MMQSEHDETAASSIESNDNCSAHHEGASASPESKVDEETEQATDSTADVEAVHTTTRIFKEVKLSSTAFDVGSHSDFASNGNKLYKLNDDPEEFAFYLADTFGCDALQAAGLVSCGDGAAEFCELLSHPGSVFGFIENEDGEPIGIRNAPGMLFDATACVLDLAGEQRPATSAS